MGGRGTRASSWVVSRWLASAQQAEAVAAQVHLEGMGLQKARSVVRAALAEQGIQAKLDAVVTELFAE